MPFGIAILGVGSIAKLMLKSLLKADPKIVVVAAIGSRSLEKAQQLAAEYKIEGVPAPLAFGSYLEAISHPSVHGVYIAVPTSVEDPLVMQAIERGKHVLADKPFYSAGNFAQWKKEAAKNNLLLMDGTHFVHSPRTCLLRRKLREGIIGELQTLIATFYNGELEPGNIREEPNLEPLGAIGDLAWYTARAAVEYLLEGEGDKTKVSISSVSSANTSPSPGQTVSYGSSIVTFSNGRQLISSAGFTGAWDQSLTLIGTKGIIKLNDFVMDHHCSEFFPGEKRLEFYVFRGKNIDPVETYTVGPFDEHNERLKPPSTRMFERFAKDASNPSAHEDWSDRSLQTQHIVDSMHHGKVLEGRLDTSEGQKTYAEQAQGVLTGVSDRSKGSASPSEFGDRDREKEKKHGVLHTVKETVKETLGIAK